MKALIDNVKFKNEFESKFGILYSHVVSWYGKDEKIEYGFYSSKKKDQTYFKAGQESEFTVEEKQGKQGNFFVVKPLSQGNFSGYNKNLKREQSKYAGFAASYCKDLIIADKLNIKDWEAASKKIFNFMVELDKSIE